MALETMRTTAHRTSEACSPNGTNSFLIGSPHTQSRSASTANDKKLQDLFHETLKDIYFAEKKILSTLPKMAKAASPRTSRLHPEARGWDRRARVAAWEDLRRDRQNASRQDMRCNNGDYWGGERNHEGIQRRSRLDAGLLAAAQAVEHYEIARYGTLKTWAAELGLNQAVKFLEKTLAEEKKTDEALTQLAEGAVNRHAEVAWCAWIPPQYGRRRPWPSLDKTVGVNERNRQSRGQCDLLAKSPRGMSSKSALGVKPADKVD
jgi:ferritin-like metal-binding protein YciE